MADRKTETRRRLLGVAEPAADDLILAWLGVSTFALAIGGRVLLLDAWIPRGFAASRVPATVDDLVALDPDAILVGHGHFDHAADLAMLAGRTNAVVIRGPGSDVDAVPGVRITAVPHVHSAPVLPRGRLRLVAPRPDPSPLWRARGSWRDVRHLLRHLRDPGGTSVLYRLEGGGRSLVWHDTTGPLVEKAPAVIETLRSLGPTDVHVGAIMGFNQLLNGLEDVRTYVEAIRPTVFVPNHHDHWLPPLTVPGARYERHLAHALDGLDDVEIRFLSDPQDYARPLAFRA